MLFSLSTATAILAMAYLACAQTKGFASLIKPDTSDKLPVGSSFDIKWQCPSEYASRTVKLILIGGATQNTQVELETVTPSVPCSAGQFTWTVPNTPEQNFHGLKIIDVNDANTMQYSQPFQIIGGSPAVSSSTQGVNTAASTSSTAVPYGTPSAPTVNTPAVETPAVAPKASVVPAPQSDVDCNCDNATAPVNSPNAPAAGSNDAAPAPAPVPAPAPSTKSGVSSGIPSRSNNSTGPGIPVTTAGAPMVQAGLLSLVGGMVAFAMVL